MLNLNKVIIAGRVSWKGELKVIPRGDTILNFQIAESEYAGKNEDGTPKEPSTEFISCIAWGKTAEFVSKFFEVGTPIYVEGRIRTTEYDKQGVKVKQTNVYIKEARFLTDKPKQTAPQQASAPEPQTQAPTPTPAPQQYQTAFEPDELPF